MRALAELSWLRSLWRLSVLHISIAVTLIIPPAHATRNVSAHNCQPLAGITMSEPSTNPLRVALRSLTHGVYVLSVREEERDEYLIISLAMQCSVEPPRIAFAVTPDARVLPLLRSAQGGVLSILELSQIAAVRRYGAPGGVKHLPIDPRRTVGLHPIPPEASYWLRFTLIHETSVGDHILFVATVEDGGKLPSTNDAAAIAHTSQSFQPLTLVASGLPYAG